MTAARSDLVQTSRGEFVPADRRTVIARAVLSVLQNPSGIETLDWQIADAVLPLLSGAGTKSDGGDQ